MKPKTIPSPIRVKAVGKPIMIATTIRVSIRSPSAGSLMVFSALVHALARGFVDRLRRGDRTLAGILVAVLAVGELLLAHVDLFRVLEARGPLAGLQAHDAAHD